MARYGETYFTVNSTSSRYIRNDKLLVEYLEIIFCKKIIYGIEEIKKKKKKEKK